MKSYLNWKEKSDTKNSPLNCACADVFNYKMQSVLNSALYNVRWKYPQIQNESDFLSIISNDYDWQWLSYLGDPNQSLAVAGDFGRHRLYKMLGYFSLVGLLRLHSLLGDYHQALKVVENMNVNRKVCRLCCGCLLACFLCELWPGIDILGLRFVVCLYERQNRGSTFTEFDFITDLSLW